MKDIGCHAALRGLEPRIPIPALPAFTPTVKRNIRIRERDPLSKFSLNSQITHEKFT
jgi:hypothetical protein